jgi:hypothetical protein
MSTSLVTFDGVLRSSTSLVPIPEGRLLFEALKVMGRVVLLCENAASTTHWCLQHNVKPDDIISDSVAVDPAEPLRRRQITHARAAGRVDLVVDPDPELIAWTLAEGLTGLLFTHPEHMLPRNRPDFIHTRRSWGQIQDELERQLKPLPEPEEG